MKSLEAKRFSSFLEAWRPSLESELERRLPPAGTWPATLHQALRNAVLGAGKRVRPAIVLGVGAALGLAEERLLPVAAAIELLHTYSLVHDDLPALDDDDWRRGRPTLHRLHGEATAILAGDALLTLGLGLLAREPAEAPAELRAEAVGVVSEALSSRGMVGGQQEDLETSQKWPEDPVSALRRIHRGKTAALFGACCEVASLHAGSDPAERGLLRRYGILLGEVFQLRDDILDVEGNMGDLGKTPGKDALQRKLTAVALWGLEGARRELASRAEEAMALAARVPDPHGFLRAAVLFASQRGS